MFEPKFSFITNNLVAEAEYICFLAKNISLGLYQNNDYFVLPYLAKNNPKTVFSPDFPYSKHFWQSIHKCKNLDYGKNFPQRAIQEIVGYLQEKQSLLLNEQLQIKTTIINWKSNQSDLLKIINESFENSNLRKIRKVEILLTNYGTEGSFNVVYEKNGDAKICCTARIDSGIEHIAKTILRSIYLYQSKKRTEIGEINWYKRQAAVDFYFHNSKLAKIFTKKTPKKSNSYNVSDKIQTQSREYLAKLGFPPKLSLTCKDKTIYFDSKSIHKQFARQEQLILIGLIEKKGEVVTFDEAGDLIWQDKSLDKFSLVALAKVIENIRKKFRKLGINDQIIKTVRGQGYFLK